MQFLKNPVLWAYGVGIAFNSFHIQIPLLSNLFSTLSQALLLLIMLLIAVEFELSFSMLTFPALAMYLKMAVGVTIGQFDPVAGGNVNGIVWIHNELQGIATMPVMVASANGQE